jgi:hypothetical protein
MFACSKITAVNCPSLSNYLVITTKEKTLVSKSIAKQQNSSDVDKLEELEQKVRDLMNKLHEYNPFVRYYSNSWFFDIGNFI